MAVLQLKAIFCLGALLLPHSPCEVTLEVFIHAPAHRSHPPWPRMRSVNSTAQQNSRVHTMHEARPCFLFFSFSSTIAKGSDQNVTMALESISPCAHFEKNKGGQPRFRSCRGCINTRSPPFALRDRGMPTPLKLWQRRSRGEMTRMKILAFHISVLSLSLFGVAVQHTFYLPHDHPVLHQTRTHSRERVSVCLLLECTRRECLTNTPRPPLESRSAAANAAPRGHSSGVTMNSLSLHRACRRHDVSLLPL